VRRRSSGRWRRVEVAAYQIAGGGVTNAVRHSAAARVALGRRVPVTSAEVRTTAAGCRPALRRRGLRSMAERAAEVGGRLDVGRRPAAGRRCARGCRSAPRPRRGERDEDRRRVVVVDDHPCSGPGWSRAGDLGGIEVAGEAADGVAALDVVAAARPTSS
jgi:hypothetical protein